MPTEQADLRAAEPGLFYGWRIVGVSFLTLFFTVGFGFYSFGAFFKVLGDELGGSRFGVAAINTLFQAVMALLAPFLGREIDRRSVRRIMTVGSVLLAIGFALASRAGTLWHIYLVFGTVLALGAAMVGQLPATTLVANWFVARRGMALGIATMGISLSGVVMAPVATALIAWVGWRGTFLIYAGVTLMVVTPCVLGVVVNEPEDIGLRPDGRRAVLGPGAIAGLAGAPPPKRPALSTRELIGQRSFWVIGLTIALNFCANGALLTHLIPHATDLGFAPTPAALVLSLAALLGVGGKVLFGGIADRVDLRLALWLATSLQTVSLVMLLLLPARPAYGALLFAGAVFGLGMGGIVPLWGSLVGACFGRRSFGRATGLMSPIMLPIQMLGIPFAGWVFDRTGSYDRAFQTFVVVYLASMLALTLLRLPKSPSEGDLD